MIYFSFSCHADEGSIPTHLSGKEGKRYFVPQDDKNILINSFYYLIMKYIEKSVKFVNFLMS